MRKIITIIFSAIALSGLAQPGGRHVFDFLQLPAHARLTALGGVNVSLADKDVNFFLSNPALAGDTLNGFASAGYQFYLADIGNALFTYAHDFGKAGQIMAAIQHTDYGTLNGFDDAGMETADVSSGETAILVGKSHQIANIRLGATLKAVFSNIAGYRASALMMDVGGVFKHPEQDLTVGLVIKNVGVVLSHYTATATESVPFDVQAGATLKPQYMPLRFSLTAWNLTRGDLLAGSDAAGENISTLKNVFSHV
ncbi:MAG TPA: type IX secretion system protein PorQ, partial [Chryseosolibacter sp.]